MVFHVMEHVVGHDVLEPSSLRTGETADRLTIVMHGPHSEERREALAGDHGQHVGA
jgi:hypothetical protein